MPVSLTLTLPVPPLPLSRCFNNFGRRRIESEDYKAWKAAVGKHLVMYHRHALGTPLSPTISGQVRVDFSIRPRRDKRKQDLDNCLKCLGDLLTQQHVIEDDSKITDLRIRWGQFDMAHDVVIEVEKAA